MQERQLGDINRQLKHKVKKLFTHIIIPTWTAHTEHQELHPHFYSFLTVGFASCRVCSSTLKAATATTTGPCSRSPGLPAPSWMKAPPHITCSSSSTLIIPLLWTVNPLCKLGTYEPLASSCSIFHAWSWTDYAAAHMYARYPHQFAAPDQAANNIPRSSAPGGENNFMLGWVLWASAAG